MGYHLWAAVSSPLTWGSKDLFPWVARFCRSDTVILAIHPVNDSSYYCWSYMGKISIHVSPWTLSLILLIWLVKCVYFLFFHAAIDMHGWTHLYLVVVSWKRLTLQASGPLWDVILYNPFMRLYPNLPPPLVCLEFLFLVLCITCPLSQCFLRQCREANV